MIRNIDREGATYACRGDDNVNANACVLGDCTGCTCIENCVQDFLYCTRISNPNAIVARCPCEASDTDCTQRTRQKYSLSCGQNNTCFTCPTNGLSCTSNTGYRGTSSKQICYGIVVTALCVCTDDTMPTCSEEQS